MADAEALLKVDDLHIEFRTQGRRNVAVNGVSFDVQYGSTLGIVGESGSGKSVTAFAVAGLLQAPGRVTGGSVRFQNTVLTGMSDRRMRDFRGTEIGIVFQDPMTALNPVMRVGDQIVEAIRAHQTVSKVEALRLATDMLRDVGIPEPERRMRDYPNALSGGMRQRVVIAIAMANSPALLILDEPTTALDVTVQAQILDLVKKLRTDYGSSVLFISHDIGVVSSFCDDVIVMYGGEVLERLPASALADSARHPYTVGLLNSLPDGHNRQNPVHPIPGTVPAPGDMPPGCPFANRCAHAMDRCQEAPPMVTLADSHEAACWLLGEER